MVIQLLFTPLKSLLKGFKRSSKQNNPTTQITIKEDLKPSFILFKGCNTANALTIYKYFQLIDFVKFEVHSIDPEFIESNSLLDFKTIVNKKTGELGSYAHASFYGLIFKIYNVTTATPYKRITVEGSLHIYWNMGKHNFNDFSLASIYQVLNDLKNKFCIEPKNCRLQQLELGVNITPNETSSKIIRGCIMHKKDAFKSIYTKHEGEYVQVIHQRKTIKIYDKKKHYSRKYSFNNEILRFEIKFQDMHDLRKIYNIHTLQDLLNFDLKNCIKWLILEWDNILFFDKSIFKGLKEETNYKDWTFWEDLKPDNFKYHRNKLNLITNNNPQNLKEHIKQLIIQKGNQLTQNYPN